MPDNDNDILISKLIADEFDNLVIVLDKQNQPVMLNNCARRLLGGGLAAGSALSALFGQDNLYEYIAALAFNYRWQGLLQAATSDGMKPLRVNAKYIAGQRGVFQDLLLIGRIAPESESSPDDFWDQDQQQLRKLCEISSTINSSLDYQSICAEITMQAAELIGADRSLLYSVNNCEIGVLATWNMTDFERNLFRLVNMEHGVIKNCLKNMAPVLVPYYSSHPDWIPEIYRHLDFESFILYPLLAQKQLVGVLALFGKEPMRFSDHHLMLLQMISNQMAIAVLNAQVHSEIRNLNKHLEEEVCLKVHELKISELQLIRKHAELEAVFHAITDVLVVVDDGLRILDINKAAENYYGCRDKNTVVGKFYCDTLCERQACKSALCRQKQCSSNIGADGMRPCTSCYLQESLVSGEPATAEVDMGDRVFMVSICPIVNETGKVDKIVCCTRDMTLTKRKREELMQYQKMQAVGHLAAGVAHEIRNPLGAISNYVYILENWFQELEEAGGEVDQEVKGTLAAITRLVARSENVIKNLLDFSRNKPSDIRSFRMREVLEQILMLVGKTAQRKNIKIVIAGDEDLIIRSDSNAMQHILFNLIINAIDALTEGGEIGIEYAALPGKLRFSVSDNGTGINSENITKVFNPFYTTKSPDRGTGLGLYVVYNLVEQLMGTVTAVSDPGVRTVFTVTIPHDGRG